MDTRLLRSLTSPWSWATVFLLIVFWYFTAYYQGALMATIDGIWGHDEIQSCGYPARERGDYARLLKERYGIQLKSVAGCVVSERLCEYVAGYNTVTTRRLLKKHGRNVFEECWPEAQEQWRAKNPDWNKER